MEVIATARLVLRELEASDAGFVHALLTDADFLAMIGRRSVDTPDDAARAIEERYRASYREHGFGMWAVVPKNSGAPVGLAGLVRREGLEHADIGYALLPAARGQGYAKEAASAIMAWAAERGITPVVAIVSPNNAASIAVLESLGLVADRPIRLRPEEAPVMLYVPAG